MFSIIDAHDSIGICIFIAQLAPAILKVSNAAYAANDLSCRII